MTSLHRDKCEIAEKRRDRRAEINEKHSEVSKVLIWGDSRAAGLHNAAVEGSFPPIHAEIDRSTGYAAAHEASAIGRLCTF